MDEPMTPFFNIYRPSKTSSSVSVLISKCLYSKVPRDLIYLAPAGE